MRYVIVQNDAHHSLEVLLGLVCAGAMIYSLFTGKPVNVGNPGHEQRRGAPLERRLGGGPRRTMLTAGQPRRTRRPVDGSALAGTDPTSARVVAPS